MASGEDYDILVRPVNNCLIFAGEATYNDHPNTVGGALMTGMREANQILDILTMGIDFTAEVEAIAAAKRHPDSEISEVRDVIRRLDTIEPTHFHKNFVTYVCFSFGLIQTCCIRQLIMLI